MRQRRTSIRPLTSTSTMPPPAAPVTRRFRISSVIWPIWPPICWACFNSAPRLASPLNTALQFLICSRHTITSDRPPAPAGRRTARPPDVPADARAPRPDAGGPAPPSGAGGSGCPAVFREGKLHPHRPPGHLGQGLLESGNLLGPLAAALADSIARLEADDQTIGRGKVHGIELPGLLATMPESRTAPDSRLPRRFPAKVQVVP